MTWRNRASFLPSVVAVVVALGLTTYLDSPWETGGFCLPTHIYKRPEAMMTQDDRTLNETLALYRLRDTGTTKGTKARRDIERDIRIKLGKKRFSAYDKQAIQNALDPYPSYGTWTPRIDHDAVVKLSKMALFFTGSRDIDQLLDAITTGELRVVPRELA
jgi:hypothetical protein